MVYSALQLGFIHSIKICTVHGWFCRPASFARLHQWSPQNAVTARCKSEPSTIGNNRNQPTGRRQNKGNKVKQKASDNYVRIRCANGETIMTTIWLATTEQSEACRVAACKEVVVSDNCVMDLQWGKWKSRIHWRQGLKNMWERLNLTGIWLCPHSRHVAQAKTLHWLWWSDLWYGRRYVNSANQIH